MSTVVITPTHIACDHTVVYHTLPNTTMVDLTYKKIYIAPNKKYLIGTTGQFVPDDIDQTKMWDCLGGILGIILSNLTLGNIYEDEFHLCYLDDKDSMISTLMLYYAQVFDPWGKTFIATRSYRFVIWLSKSLKVWKAKRLGDYAGVGTGGAMAAGMLAGGMKITDIWTPLHTFDHHTSAEHTIVPLSVLKTEGRVNAKLNKIRQSV